MPTAASVASPTPLQVRGFPCDCQYPELCDSQQGALPPTRMALQRQRQQQEEEREGGAEAGAAAAGGEQREAGGSEEGTSLPASGSALRGEEEERRLQQLEDRYVNGVYNAIAPHFR